MAVATFGETYRDPRRGSGEALTSEDIVFATPQGEISRILVTAQGVGLVDFALIPHLDHEDHPDASLANAEKWAARLPMPTYAIDDQTAIKVLDGAVEVASDGAGTPRLETLNWTHTATYLIRKMVRNALDKIRESRYLSCSLRR
ncbi:hypothetical protein KSC_018860 [Ktedonobacter sp. SOSP1-52]|nr:hypothetical protein KSC_018860 [Ktedonobacter sp. SOSP1-52]